MLTDYEMDFLENLISIKSCSGTPENGAPYGRTHRDALDFFLGKASEEGFETGVINDKAGWVETGTGPLLGILCHLDVVPEGIGWNSDPFELKLENGLFTGRGIVDDKGPAAASFFAMRRLKEHGLLPDCRVRLILGTDEERTCDCVEEYAKHCEIPEFAITPDAEFPVIFAEKGILQIKIQGMDCDRALWADAGSAANMVPAKAVIKNDKGLYVEADGVPSHASRPELGKNAIFEAVAKLSDADIGRSLLLQYINGYLPIFDAERFTGCDMEDLSGKVTANPAILKICDGTESLVCDIRYPATYPYEKILDYIGENAARYGLTVSVTSHMKPLIKDKDAEQVKILTDIWKDNMHLYEGYRDEYKDIYSEPIAIGGGTYARHIPNTIAFGLQAPWAKDQCHQANESRCLTDFEADIKVLSEAIKKLGQSLL
ncbi:MAG: Sapep family Mn(2+)-dependent dipeptidase [Clostridiales bacterium]|nr:Sapep family Mn(2+)-dependent dipeptidase [Clostridiales bacterium]